MRNTLITTLMIVLSTTACLEETPTATEMEPQLALTSSDWTYIQGKLNTARGYSTDAEDDAELAETAWNGFYTPFNDEVADIENRIQDADTDAYQAWQYSLSQNTTSMLAEIKSVMNRAYAIEMSYLAGGLEVGYGGGIPSSWPGYTNSTAATNFASAENAFYKMKLRLAEAVVHANNGDWHLVESKLGYNSTYDTAQYWAHQGANYVAGGKIALNNAGQNDDDAFDMITYWQNVNYFVEYTLREIHLALIRYNDATSGGCGEFC